MATGSVADILARLQRWAPKKWFPANSSGPVSFIGGVMTGMATTMSGAYARLAYAKLQTRIKTATDGFLDLISWDFFGGALPRRAGEPDDAYRTRLLPNILRPRVVRHGIEVTLKTLTGRTPQLFEPIRVSDTGAFEEPFIGFDMAGAFTDYNLFPYQMLVVAYMGNGATAGDVYAAVEASRPVATIAWVAMLPNAVRLMDAPNSQFIPCIGRF